MRWRWRRGGGGGGGGGVGWVKSPLMTSSGNHHPLCALGGGG